MFSRPSSLDGRGLNYYTRMPIPSSFKLGLCGRGVQEVSYNWWVVLSRLLAKDLVRIPTVAVSTCCKPLSGSYQLWMLHCGDIIRALI